MSEIEIGVIARDRVIAKQRDRKIVFCTFASCLPKLRKPITGSSDRPPSATCLA